MSKITGYSAFTAPADSDLLLGVDVSDTSMAATGTDKNLTLAALRSYYLKGTPLSGPNSAQPTVFAQSDGSLLVIPLSYYSLTGDDAVWINYAFSQCPQPASSGTSRVSGPAVVKLLNGYQYTTTSTITIPLSCYLDLNSSCIYFTGSNDDVVYIHGGAGAFRQEQFRPGGVFGGTIDGSGAGANVNGINYGDGQDFDIGQSGRLRVENFNGSNNVGLYEYNQFHYTEKARVCADIYNCKLAMLFDVNAPPLHSGGTAGTSHEYNQYDVHLSLNVNQSGLRMVNNAWFGRATMHLYGNAFFDNSAVSGQILLDISDSTGVSFQNCRLDIMMETTASGSGGSYTLQTIKFGSTGFIHNCMGLISFADANWSLSDIASTGGFSFGGPVQGDANLIANQTKPGGWL